MSSVCWTYWYFDLMIDKSQGFIKVFSVNTEGTWIFHDNPCSITENYRKSPSMSNVIRLHLIETMTICTKLCGNPQNSRDLSIDHLPNVNWVRLQPTLCEPVKDKRLQTMDGWMDGLTNHRGNDTHTWTHVPCWQVSSGQQQISVTPCWSCRIWAAPWACRWSCPARGRRRCPPSSPSSLLVSWPPGTPACAEPRWTFSYPGSHPCTCHRDC